ncbi:Transcription initiation factor IIE subunit beta [Homalodisca vitripennis]|nr:Transcription initiation factor IIE subunit beta [Homalodisca vitripennis]
MDRSRPCVTIWEPLVPLNVCDVYSIVTLSHLNFPNVPIWLLEISGKISLSLLQSFRTFPFIKRTDESTAHSFTPTLPASDYRYPQMRRNLGLHTKVQGWLKQGIRSMQDHGIKKVTPIHKRKKPNQRKKQLKRPRDNEHLADVLENYDDK